MNTVLGFLWWLLTSLATLGGLVQWFEKKSVEINGTDLLAHGLLNSFSRSDSGSTSPAYIPPGAFVSALFDIVVGGASTTPLSAAQATTVSSFFTGIQNTRPAAGNPLTFSAYKTTLDAFTTNYSTLVDKPAAGTLIANLHEQVTADLSRAAVRDALLNPTVTTATAAQAIIDDPANAAYKPVLDTLIGPAISAETQATAALGQPNANATKASAILAYEIFRVAASDWFSLPDSFNSLQSTAAIVASQLIATTAQLSAARVEAGIKAIENKKLQTALLSLFESAGRDVRLFKLAVEGWFNGVMDRVSGWYRRFAQKWMIVLGLILAALFNVDSIAIVRELSNNPHLAKAVAEQAETYVSSNGRPLTANELGALRETRLQAVQKAEQAEAEARAAVEPDAEKLKQLAGETAAARAEADTLSAYQGAVTKLYSVGLPVGWTPQVKQRLGVGGTGGLDFLNLGEMLAGWFLTAVAASFGAPFWFDLLGRFVNIRAAGRSPGEKEAASTPTKPAPANLDTTPGTGRQTSG